DGDDFPPLGDLDDLDLENLDSDLDFLSGTDESETKLDLARAYIDMEDQDGAREILQEVLDEGSDQQKQEATKLMDSLV
ncbi:MAG: pilus assembly protein FimV, partial [Bermanella sp.]